MNIRPERRKLHISQPRLAKLAGVSRYKICLHEIGDAELSSQELRRIEAALRKEAGRLRAAIAGIIPTTDSVPRI